MKEKNEKKRKESKNIKKLDIVYRTFISYHINKTARKK